ncbi:hypothetical protein TgHK011_000473 [Trichoderma gracile]|nr:hypothetical protein TgHK011_000473 [Trichoderma gracile]
MASNPGTSSIPPHYKSLALETLGRSVLQLRPRPRPRPSTAGFHCQCQCQCLATARQIEASDGPGGSIYTMGWRRLGLPPACAAASEGHRARATARNNSAHAKEVGIQTSGAAQSTHGGANLTFHRPASTSPCSLPVR